MYLAINYFFHHYFMNSCFSNVKFCIIFGSNFISARKSKRTNCLQRHILILNLYILHLCPTELQALWLEEGGSALDSHIYEGLSRLTSLRRLCLFNFVVGPKLGQALKKLPRLERLFILPVAAEGVSSRGLSSFMFMVVVWSCR